MSRFFKVAWLVARKDLRVELRSWELLSTTVFFAVAAVLVFAFAFVRQGRAVDGQRWHHRVDAAAVGQAGVADR